MKRLCCLLALLLAWIPAHAAATRPNFLIVLVDDAGYGDFSCHGHPWLKTPNIDRLHDESVRFTDFHVAPMCTPTRGQLLTGMDALRNSAASVTAGRAFLRPGISTLPQQLAKAGYDTGIFGKWHLGDSYPHRPMEKGFQTAVWIKGWGFTSAPEFNNTLVDGRFYRGTEEIQFKGYVTDFCFDEAMNWMKQRGEKHEPFFCYLPLNAAHAPCIVPEKYSAPFANRRAPGFFGMLANIDENMGRLDAFLRDSGLRDNTIVIFMTDNGGTAGVPVFNAGLRGHKTEYYEGGHRVPCFVRWPAAGWAARDVSVPAQVQDIMPTLLELGGASIDETKRDGVSLATLLKGGAAPADRMLVVQFGASPPFPDDPVKGRSCVIWNQWRLVHGTELYDVNADRTQTHDLAKDQPAVLEKMRAYYEKWWAGIQPQLHDFIPLSLGATQQNPVQLTSSDWQDTYADNSDHIRNAAGGPQGGPWNVNVEQAGQYDITVRRWPFDSNAALDGNVDPPGKALPIRLAKLKIAGVEQELKTAPGDRDAVFHLDLPAGRTQLHAWFQDEKGSDLCGAFYVKVLRH
jgi:arylsulfatase